MLAEDRSGHLRACEPALGKCGLGLMAQKLVVVIGSRSPRDLSVTGRDGGAQASGQLEDDIERHELMSPNGRCPVHTSPTNNATIKLQLAEPVTKIFRGRKDESADPNDTSN